MNEFLRLYGMNPNQGATYVIVPEEGSAEIVAYFNLGPDIKLLAQVPADEELSDCCIWLRYLVVAEKYQRQGIGRRILVYVIEDVLHVSEIHPQIESLNLRALDEIAKDWYLHLKFGFQELATGSGILVLSVDEMRRAQDAEASTEI